MNREEIEKIRIRLVKLTPHSFREIPEVDDVFDQAAMVEELVDGMESTIALLQNLPNIKDETLRNTHINEARLYLEKALNQKEKG